MNKKKIIALALSVAMLTPNAANIKTSYAANETNNVSSEETDSVIKLEQIEEEVDPEINYLESTEEDVLDLKNDYILNKEFKEDSTYPDSQIFEEATDTSELEEKNAVNSQIRNYNYLKKPSFSTQYFISQEHVAEHTLDFAYEIQKHDYYNPGTIDMTELAQRIQRDKRIKVDMSDGKRVSKVFFEMSDLMPMYVNDVEEYENRGSTVNRKYNPNTMEITEFKYTPNTIDQTNNNMFAKFDSGTYTLPNKSQVQKSVAKADKIVREMPNFSTDTEKAKWLADYLAKTNSYIYENGSYGHNNHYGALIKGYSRCDGFAQAYSMLLRRAGIPAYRVAGNSDGLNQSTTHAWNVIYIQNKWLMVDITSGACSSIGAQPDKAFGGTPYNDYFKKYRMSWPYTNIDQNFPKRAIDYKKDMNVNSSNIKESVEAPKPVNKSALRSKILEIKNALIKNYNFKYTREYTIKITNEAIKVYNDKNSSQTKVDNALKKLQEDATYKVVNKRALKNQINDIKYALTNNYKFEYSRSMVIKTTNDAIKVYNKPSSTIKDIKDQLFMLDIFCQYDKESVRKTPKIELRELILDLKDNVSSNYSFNYSKSYVISVTNEAIRVYNRSTSTNSDYQREIDKLKKISVSSSYSNARDAKDEVVDVNENNKLENNNEEDNLTNNELVPDKENNDSNDQDKNEDDKNNDLEDSKDNIEKQADEDEDKEDNSLIEENKDDKTEDAHQDDQAEEIEVKEDDKLKDIKEHLRTTVEDKETELNSGNIEYQFGYENAKTVIDNTKILISEENSDINEIDLFNAYVDLMVYTTPFTEENLSIEDLINEWNNMNNLDPQKEFLFNRDELNEPLEKISLEIENVENLDENRILEIINSIKVLSIQK